MTPLLVYALDDPGRERVVVDDDGTVRYEVLSGARADLRDRVGMFTATLDGAGLQEAERLARELVATDPATRGRTGPVVTASIDGAEATHPLYDPTAAAALLLSESIDLARERPVAVLRLAVEVVEGSDLRLTLENIGTEPVVFQLDPAALRLRAESDGTWTTAWQGPPARGLSLVASLDGDTGYGFLGGVTAPASLEPGQVARGLLSGVLAGPGPSRIQLAVEGTIVLPDNEPDGPFGGDDIFGDTAVPSARFRLTSPPVALG